MRRSDVPTPAPVAHRRHHVDALNIPQRVRDRMKETPQSVVAVLQRRHIDAPRREYGRAAGAATKMHRPPPRGLGAYHGFQEVGSDADRVANQVDVPRGKVYAALPTSP